MIQIRYWLEQYKKIILISLGILLVVFLGGTIYYSGIYSSIRKEKGVIQEFSIEKKEDIEKEEEEEKKIEIKEDESSTTTLVVDIKGAILNPGVYEVEEGKRVQDVVMMASGLREDADISLINLSKKVTDEMVIIIYTKEEVSSFYEESKNPSEEDTPPTCPDSILINDACIESGKEIENSSTEMKRISINQGSLEELMTIPGIGQSKAQSIIDYRNQFGPFQNLSDLIQVSGIGDTLFAKIEEYIIL